MTQTPPPKTEKDGPCVVGLTGGLASGKSTVAALLAQRGVPIFDADRAVHTLYEPRAEGSRAVEALFGTEVLDTQGGVDRDALSKRVLEDPADRRLLESAIHPLVRRKIADWIGGLENVAAAVVEAALLVETGSYRRYDILVVVWCQLHQQLQRAVARGVPAERARKLINAQIPLDDKRELADVVINNSGDSHTLAREVDNAWSEILDRCRGDRPTDHSDEDDPPGFWKERRRS